MRAGGMTGMPWLAALAVLHVGCGGQPEEVSKQEQRGEPRTVQAEHATIADQLQRADKLKRLRAGLDEYLTAEDCFPPAASFDEQGNPLLSWRVHLLPFLGEKELYDQFHLGEPWDSAHNIKLLERMPTLFASDNEIGTGKTRFMVFVGNGAVFSEKDPAYPGRFREGTVWVILFAEAAPEKAIPWTKPADLPFDPQNPWAALGKMPAEGFLVAFGNGDVRRVTRETDTQALASLISATDGEPMLNPHVFTEPIATSDRVRRTRQLQDILKAILQYEDAKHVFPHAYTRDPKGNPLLSWRVEILPYLGEQALYDEFQLDEPWDGPHNKKLIGRMPDVYRAGEEHDGKATVMVFAGEDTPFGSPDVTRYEDFIDGTVNTIFFVDAPPEKAAPWTKPEELPFVTNDPMSALGEIPENGLLAVFGDGAVRVITKDLAPDVLANAIMHQDGERTRLEQFR